MLICAIVLVLLFYYVYNWISVNQLTLFLFYVCPVSTSSFSILFVYFCRLRRWNDITSILNSYCDSSCSGAKNLIKSVKTKFNSHNMCSYFSTKEEIETSYLAFLNYNILTFITHIHHIAYLANLILWCTPCACMQCPFVTTLFSSLL